MAKQTISKAKKATAATVKDDAPAPKSRAPGPRSLINPLIAFKKNAVTAVLDLHREFGNMVEFRLGQQRAFLFVEPAAVQHLLVDAKRNYSKETVNYKKLRLALGDGLLTNEGDSWFRQRRLMQPAFHREKLSHFGEVMVSSASALADQWDARKDTSVPVDVNEAMMAVTLDIVGKTMFSTLISNSEDSVGSFMDVTLTYLQLRMNSITRTLDFVESLPTPANRKFREALKHANSVFFRIIEERRAASDFPPDLLSMLLQARDADTGEAMTDQQVRDEIATMVIAGHETTAKCLVWTLHLLGLHPEIAAQLHDELRAVLGDRLPTSDDVPKLEVTTSIIKESMRIFPPAWIIERRAIADDEVCGYRVSAGALVMVASIVTHRSPAIWGDDAHEFIPARFRGVEAEKNRHRYAYFPFGGGPHQCIGNNFAMMEAVLVLATLAQRYEFETVLKETPVMLANVTLSPKGGLPMRLSRRVD